MFSLLNSPKRDDFQAGLDVVLLFICLIGPLLMGLFSILSLSAGPEESKQDRWEMSLTSAITDIVCSIVQVRIMSGWADKGCFCSFPRPNTSFF